MTFSGSLFVASRNLLFGVFKENYQTSITERCTFLSKRSGISAKSFESTWGKNKSLKNLYYKLTSSQVICSGFQQDFFHLFAYPPIYRSLFVSYIAHILCICIHICKRYYFPLLLFLRWKAKEKQVLFLDDISTSQHCALGADKVMSFFCLNVFTQENWIISDLKPMLLSYRNNLFDLHDKITDWRSA